MQAYVLRTLVQIPISVLGITIVIFFLVRLHGDPVDLYLTPRRRRRSEGSSQAQLGSASMLVQYGHFVFSMIRGNFAESMWFKKPAIEVILDTIPATVHLMALGTICTLRKGSLLDLSFMSRCWGGKEGCGLSLNVE
jgi:peptide/nickel transport system permease protein